MAAPAAGRQGRYACRTMAERPSRGCCTNTYNGANGTNINCRGTLVPEGGGARRQFEPGDQHGRLRIRSSRMHCDPEVCGARADFHGGHVRDARGNVISATLAGHHQRRRTFPVMCEPRGGLGGKNWRHPGGVAETQDLPQTKHLYRRHGHRRPSPSRQASVALTGTRSLATSAQVVVRNRRHV